MRQFHCILLGMVLLLGSCKSHTQGNATASVKREIPAYLYGDVDIFYQLAKDRQKQLGLDSLENGFHGLQIRIWYNFSREKERKLIVITNKATNWTAAVYLMQVDLNGNRETILSEIIKQVSPKSGWPVFSKKLLDLKILTLLNQDDVEGYTGGKDGRTYSVELATKDEYRFYSYWEPQGCQDRFWQAKNMTEIIKLLEIELDM